MAENKSGQGAKDEIKKGMSETGSGSTTGSSAGSDKVSPAEER
jgi:hypothetical protein